MKVAVHTDEDEFFEPENNEHEDKDAGKTKGAQETPKTKTSEPSVAPEDETPASPEAAGAEKTGVSDTEEPDEAALVEAAIRAGEQAAEEDLKAEAEKRQEQINELANELATTQQEAIEARAQADEANEKFLRLQADWENFRKRTANERANERAYATEGLVSKILPVIDDMERALAHSRQNAAGNEMLLQFADGMDAVHAKLLSVLASEGVELINPVGEPFDPLFHQAVGRIEDSEAYADTVGEVYQPGYSMAGKVIREAMVTVTYGGPVRPAPDADETPADPATAADATDAADTADSESTAHPDTDSSASD